MSTFLFVVLFFFSFGRMYTAPPAQERYLQANKLYEQGEFEKAYEVYKGIQYKSPELLINMGNAAFELQQYRDALVHWRQAQRWVKASVYTLLEERIAKIHQQQGGQYTASSLQHLATYIDVYMRFIPHKIWELILLLLVSICFFARSWIQRRCWGRLIVLYLALCIVVTLLMVRYTVQNRLMGIVQHDSHVHVNKDLQARVKASLPAGQEIEVRAVHDNWYQITDGVVTGWMTQDNVQLI